MKTPSALLAFNRGLLSRLALGRIDLKRTALSAEIMTNWMPRTLGSMMLRPGLAYCHSTLNDSVALHLPFVFSTTDTALIELTNGKARFVSGQTDEVLQYEAVSTSITNGGFATDLTGWTDSDQSGATSDWYNNGGDGALRLVGTGVNEARRRQTVTVAGADQNQLHAITLTVSRGTGRLRVGTTAGASDYLDVSLAPGDYSLSFTPTGDFHIELASVTPAWTLITSVGIAAAGDIVLDTPWAEEDLQSIRYDQSGDVLFIASGSDLPQYRIERYAVRSWAIVQYLANDGPFRAANINPTTLTPSALTGTITLSASADVFKPTSVGALYRVESNGQRVEIDATGADQWSDPIRVTGVGKSRRFTIIREGTWSATVRLQRSVTEPGDWANVTSYTGNGSVTFDDDLDNQIVYYRIGIASGEYTSGTAELTLSYSAGSIQGVARVVSVASPTSATADVVKTFGNTTASSTWWEGAWSPRRGHPTAVAFYDGRLWWAGQDRVYGSVSDAFNSFDDNVEGDSGAISRSIGSGPVNSVNWLLPLTQLIVGTQGSELVARASSFDEPLTPSAFRLQTFSTLGSCRRQRAIRVDSTGVFVQCGDARVFEISYEGGSFTYGSRELTTIVPEIGEPTIDRMAVQRLPDTRIHCVRGDGKVAVLVFDPVEEVNCWLLIETDGDVIDVVTLPGTTEDHVYYVVERTIGGTTKRYLERWALESQARGGADNRIADSYVVYDGASTDTITGLSHLEGKTVVVWGSSKDLGTYTVSSGQITLTEEVTYAIIGLGYDAIFKSAKLAHSFQSGEVSLTQRQRITDLGLLLADTHARGLYVGQDLDHLDPLPEIEFGRKIGADHVWDAYGEDSFFVNGDWSTDARLCMKASAPRPVTVLACVIDHVTNPK